MPPVGAWSLPSLAQQAFGQDGGIVHSTREAAAAVDRPLRSLVHARLADARLRMIAFSRLIIGRPKKLAYAWTKPAS